MRIKVRLDARKNVQTHEGFPVVIYLTQNKKEKLIRTGYFSKKMHWDKANALPKTKHPDYVDLLNYLEQKKITIQKVLVQDRIKEIRLEEAESIITKNDSDVFYEVALDFCKNRTYLNALKSFQKLYPDYTFSQINKPTVKKFMEKLLMTPTKGGNPRSPNGVYSYMDKLTSLWNFCDKPDNPFSKMRPEQEQSQNKALTTLDLIKIRDNDYKLHPNSNGGGKKEYLDYFMLGFYLGGIDLGDLSLLRYDKNIVGNRVEFYRAKGSKKKVFISNIILPEAWELLEKYRSKTYLIPLRKNLDYNNYTANMSREYDKIKMKLGLTRKPYSKSPRFSFINRGQNLLIDERIVKSLVGHSDSGNIHAIYKDTFPLHIKDKAHKRIIDLSIDAESYEPEF